MSIDERDKETSRHERIQEEEGQTHHFGSEQQNLQRGTLV